MPFFLSFFCIQLQADVLVNSTSQQLILRHGRISKHILKEAGKELQEECSQKYPNGLCFGEVAVTQGYNLQCKQVYHVSMPPWKTAFLDPQQV